MILELFLATVVTLSFAAKLSTICIFLVCFGPGRLTAIWDRYLLLCAVALKLIALEGYLVLNKFIVGYSDEMQGAIHV